MTAVNRAVTADLVTGAVTLPKGSKQCPCCGRVKEIDGNFGWRNDKGNIILQSWCNFCRNVSGVLGNSKKWRDLSEEEILAKVEEKRALFRKPRKAKAPKAVTATVSPGLYTQQTGRALRGAPKPVKIITDCAPLMKDVKQPPAPKKIKASPAPADRETLTPDTVTMLSSDLATIKVIYAKNFPDDKQVRSWRCMVERLLKKLGKNAKLTPTAKERLGK